MDDEDVSTREKGTQFEQIAASYLKRQGMTVVETNFRFGRGEIDLICRDGEVLVFVEVKSKSSDEGGLPEDEVDARKQKQVRRMAEGYLLINKLRDIACRCDVVAITGTIQNYSIRYYKDAF